MGEKNRSESKIELGEEKETNFDNRSWLKNPPQNHEDYEKLKALVKRLESQFAEVASQRRPVKGISGTGSLNPAPKLERDINLYNGLLEKYEDEHPDEFPQ